MTSCSTEAHHPFPTSSSGPSTPASGPQHPPPSVQAGRLALISSVRNVRIDDPWLLNRLYWGYLHALIVADGRTDSKVESRQPELQ